MLQHLSKPVAVGFGGIFDTFDFSDPNLTVPTTADGSTDWSKVVLPAVAPAAPGAPLDFSTITKQIVSGAQNFYNAKSAVDQANYGSQLAKAQAQAAINIAKAGGQAATRTAAAGMPSPSLLLIAGLGLAAVVLLKR